MENTNSNYSDIDEEYLCQNHHVIKGARIFSTGKLSSKEIYSILIWNIVNKPTSNICYEKLFENTILEWSNIYLLPRLATINTINTLRSFQYKFLNNLLFLNKKIYNFGIINTAHCSFCKTLKKPPYINPAFMSNLIGKNYRRHFRMILSCNHLHYRLPFLDWPVKQTTFISRFITF